MVHSFASSKKKRGYVGLKLDFQKGYDRMEWPFLSQDLMCFGFHQKFISLIQQCISIVSFTLLLNGGLGPSVNPSRELRQEAPYLPIYSFILGSEVLARMINRSCAHRSINGIKIAPLSSCYFKALLCRWCSTSMQSKAFGGKWAFGNSGKILQVVRPAN